MQDPRRIDAALRAKYDVRGPRYTSYPPATQFAAVDQAQARLTEAELLTMERQGRHRYFRLAVCPGRAGG